MKDVLITGADRGLGFAMTKLYLEKEYRVFAGQYMPSWPDLDALKAQWGDALVLVALDIGDDASVDAALEAVQSYTDSLQVIINVAGIVRPPYKSVEEFLDGDVFHRPDAQSLLDIYNTNTLGPLRVNNRFVPLLLAGDGERSVINISSEAGSMTDQTIVREVSYGYCMSKAALNMQCHILQNTLKAHGIKVLAIDPGHMRSYMRGVLNERGTVDPDDSAAGIYQLMLQERDPNAHMYFKYNGQKLRW